MLNTDYLFFTVAMYILQNNNDMHDMYIGMRIYDMQNNL